jgi:hypothetical protein
MTNKESVGKIDLEELRKIAREAERARTGEICCRWRTTTRTLSDQDLDFFDAANPQTILALLDLIKRQQEALEPFACLTYEDLRRARSAWEG